MSDGAKLPSTGTSGLAGESELIDRPIADMGRRQSFWHQEVLADPESRFFWRSFFVAVVIPLLLVCVFQAVNTFVWDLITLSIWFGLPIYVVAKPIYQWSQNDGSLAGNVLRDLRVGVPLAPVGTDSDWTHWPVITSALVLMNVCIFYAGVDQYTYALHVSEPWGWHWSNWISMFLHWDPSHLWGNMLFLAIFAAPLEGRIGRGKLLLYYVAAGTVANTLLVLSDLAIGSEDSWSIGASGAISGVMGIYMVRCCFGRVSFGVPIFGALGLAIPVVLRIRVSPLILLTLYFVRNLSGAHATLEGVSTDIGYAAHVGGYLMGIAIGYGSGLFRDGLRESLTMRAAVRHTDGDYGQARNAQDALLERDPDHVEALLARARRDSRFRRSETSKQDYQRVVQLLLEIDRAAAAKVFLEYYEKFLAPVEIHQQLALTPALANLGKYDIATRALELAARGPDIGRDTRATALLYQGKLLTDMGLPEAAEKVYRDLMSLDPESPQAEIAEARLDDLQRRNQ